MIVYHGSNSNFSKLRIDKSLVKYRSTLENEGPGIYFSTNKQVAKRYGRYVYTLEINDRSLLDFRHIEICTKYESDIVHYIYNKFNIDISEYIDLNQVTHRIRWGGLPIYSILRNYDKKHLKAYMINCYIENIGVIKDVSQATVKIVQKELAN